jgi:hypothetical protein
MHTLGLLPGELSGSDHFLYMVPSHYCSSDEHYILIKFAEVLTNRGKEATRSHQAAYMELLVSV